MIYCPKCGDMNFLVVAEGRNEWRKYRHLVCLWCRHEWTEERKLEEIW